MTTITYVEHDGISHSVDVAPGLSLMEGAIENGVPGILAYCGGSCACATCHIYVPREWQTAVSAPSDAEAAMLELAMSVRANSRLACQIPVTEGMDGMVVRLPKAQD